MAGHLDEHHLVNEAYLRLVARFEEIPAEIVEAVVRKVHGSITGPIRDYVPILVERQAADRLREYAYQLIPLDRRPDLRDSRRGPDSTYRPERRLAGHGYRPRRRAGGWAFALAG